MEKNSYEKLAELKKAKEWKQSLEKVEDLLLSNPYAAQLHLMRAELIQLQDESTKYVLSDAAESLKRALEIEPNYFDALITSMHFYDIVCPNPVKAVDYAKQVKKFAQKALEEADEVVRDNEKPESKS